MTLFERYIGIDYSGAKTPITRLKGLRVYAADGVNEPIEVLPPSVSGKYWTRRGLAEWLVEQLMDDRPALVGIDHSFSFPLRYFEMHHLSLDWSSFLDDFQKHWPTDDDHTTVDLIREGYRDTGGKDRLGNSRWRRVAEKRCKAKSVFHFDVPGQVAKSTHAGIPWLRHIRQSIGNRVQFWPFDGWEIVLGLSLIVEAYPAIYKQDFSAKGRTFDQQDAYVISAWMQQTDLNGQLLRFLTPTLSSQERLEAGVEGWILGVE